MKRPSFQFYPADWRKDTALQFCSLSARGLWVEIMCIAHECDPYGFLRVNGKPMTAAQIGRLVGISERECIKLLDELLEAGVFSKADDGAIYSRRMVRDEQLRAARAEGGKLGAEHGVKGASYGSKGGRPRKEITPQQTPLGDDGRGVIKPPIKPPPSSSSSTSVDISTDVDIKDKREKSPRFDAQAHLVSLGVDTQVANDWLSHRKAKKAAPTLTAIDGIIREAAKARIALSDALSLSCQRGWVGFEAEWITKDQGFVARPISGRQAAISNYAAQAAAARGDHEQSIRDITGEAVRVA